MASCENKDLSPFFPSSYQTRSVRWDLIKKIESDFHHKSRLVVLLKGYVHVFEKNIYLFIQSIMFRGKEIGLQFNRLQVYYSSP